MCYGRLLASRCLSGIKVFDSANRLWVMLLPPINAAAQPFAGQLDDKAHTQDLVRLCFSLKTPGSMPSVPVFFSHNTWVHAAAKCS